MQITIHFTVSDQSWFYFQYAKQSHLRLAADSARLSFFIYSLDPECSRRARAEAGVIGVHELHGMRGSDAHSAALQAAFLNFVPGQIHVSADSDSVMLLQGWDKALEKYLLTEGVDVFGITVYEDIGGFSSGEGKYQTYKNLPCLTWMAFGPFHDFRDMVDLSPDKENPLEITTEEHSKLYNLPIGYFLMKDVGWRTPAYYRDHNLQVMVLKPLKPSRTAKVLKGLPDYHDEFELEGQTFVIHQRGSMNHRFRVDPLSRNFYRAADAYLKHPDWSVRAPFALTNAISRKWHDRVYSRVNKIKAAWRRCLQA
jgi:hypothetical protein